MYFLLSPSKTLDFSDWATPFTSEPAFLPQAKKLIRQLKKRDAQKLEKLMHISPKLGQLNWQRYQDFSTPFTPQNAKPALLAFKGDVYAAMQVETYNAQDFHYAQKHMRILSGLYGLLKPLDLIQPYRLEMGVKLAGAYGEDLYALWQNPLTQAINKEAPSLLVNLASQEYFSAIIPEKLRMPLLHIYFKEKRGDSLKVIGLFAKKARGLMADFAIREKIKKPEALKDFTESGYSYQPKLSDASNWVYTR